MYKFETFMFELLNSLMFKYMHSTCIKNSLCSEIIQRMNVSFTETYVCQQLLLKKKFHNKYSKVLEDERNT